MLKFPRATGLEINLEVVTVEKKRPFDVYSSGRLMWVNFRASRDGVQANKGFKAHFEAVDLRKFTAALTIN